MLEESGMSLNNKSAGSKTISIDSSNVKAMSSSLVIVVDADVSQTYSPNVL